MASVTVAGGSFDVARSATRTGSPAKRDRWLRYGLGVSIAALLGADAIVLTGMLREADDAIRPVPEAAIATSAGVADGDGFSAFIVPADLAAHYAARNPVVPVASAAGPTFSLPGTSPAMPTSSPLPVVPVTPTPVVVPTTPSGQETRPPSVTEPFQPVIEQTTSLIEQIPVVGPELAPVVEDAVDTVVPVVETVAEPVAAVAEPVVAPVTSPVEPVTATAGGVL